MYHPRIVRHYSYRVTDCQSRAVDACCDTAEWFDVNQYALADFLRTIGAVGAHRLNVL